MGVSELLAQLANPDTINTLSFAQKMMGGLLVSFLGMGITFIALIILQIIIALLARFTARPIVPAGQTTAAPPIEQQTVAAADDEELVAVIAAAITMFSQQTADSLVIRSITRKESQMPAWNRAGVLDQMNSRF